jgi:DUF4097 and DUF4098 domain-containing protein YvlB
MKNQSVLKMLISSVVFFLFFSVSANTEAYKKISSFQASGIQKIEIDLSSEELEIYSGNVPDIQVGIITKRKNGIPAAVQNGTILKISKEPCFELFTKRCLVRVIVPESFYADMFKAATTSGSISVQNIKSVEALFNSSSGNIICDSLMVQKSITAAASSGSVRIHKIQTQDFSAAASSGRVQAGKLTCSKAFFQTSSGSINISESQMQIFSGKSSSGTIHTAGVSCTSGYFKTSSGSIDAYGMSAGLLKIKTSSGGVFCMFNTLPGQEVYIASTSGQIRLRVPKNEGFSVSADTVSGMYRNEFTGTRLNRSDPSVRDVYKSGAVKFSLESGSGSITVEKQ